ncbi:alanine dehydrogenase [Micromonospora sp. M42]|nr:alanine dehydrogenase [Micromonospora sp. M42]
MSSPGGRCLHREGRNPPRGQEPRVPGGDHARGRQRVHPPRPRGLRRGRRRRRLQHHRRRVRRRRREDPGHRRRGVGHRRAGPQGEGADRRGVPPDARGTGALHVPAPGRLPRVHRRAGRPQGHRHRVRDGRAARPVAAAARPDVRGGRPARPPGGRLLHDAHRRRAGRAARRRLRRVRRKDRGHRRGRVRPQRAAIALGLQSEVLLLDKNVARLRSADAIYRGHLQTVASNAYEIERAVLDADLVIGAVLVPGAKAPKLISNELVSRMKPGSVLVDIAIDQGGCFEDSRPTTHADPVYKVHDSIFYCVANMPGAVPNTSTYALTNVTLPYALELANQGWQAALRNDPALALGLNTHAGKVVYGPVAEAHGMDVLPLDEVLS